MSYRFNVFTGKLDYYDSTTESGKSTVTLGENCSALKAVYIASDGKAYKASANSSINEAQVFGITIRAGNINDTVEVITYGVLNDASFSFTIGQELYLKTLGNFDQVDPMLSGMVFNKVIGFGLNAGSIFISPSRLIEL